jgi:hypothetical protein
MSSSERRIDTRVNICVPLRFRALNNPGSTEQTAESENISQRGMYFMTDVPLKVGRRWRCRCACRKSWREG